MTRRGETERRMKYACSFVDHAGVLTLDFLDIKQCVSHYACQDGGSFVTRGAARCVYLCCSGSMQGRSALQPNKDQDSTGRHAWSVRAYGEHRAAL